MPMPMAPLPSMTKSVVGADDRGTGDFELAAVEVVDADGPVAEEVPEAGDGAGGGEYELWRIGGCGAGFVEGQ